MATDALRQSGQLRMCVYGQSMLPALWPGDIVEIASCSLTDIRTGQIALALRDGQFFLHRVVAPSTKEGFVLRGDSMPGPDPVFPPEALLGRMVGTTYTARGFAGLSLTSRFCANWFGTKCSRALGMLLCHCGMARRLALKLYSRRKASAGLFRNPLPRADASSAELRA